MRGGRVQFSALSALAAGMLATALLLWGSTSGDPLISAPSTTFDVPEGRNQQPAATPTLADPEPGAPPEANSDSIINGWLLLQVLVAALLAWLILRLFRNREPAEPEGFVEPPDPLAELLEATALDGRGDAPAPFAGEPRNAVVACWVALEEGLARAGLAPAPSETSLDLTLRVLQRWEVDPQTLSDLAALYREARFSRHPITAAQRDEAVAALRDIHHTLRRAADGAAQRAAEAEHGAPDDSPTKRTAGPA